MLKVKERADFMDKSLVGLAGEYYVLAQLAQRGLVGTLTLSNTKGVDILVSNPDLSTLHKLEVKTSAQPPRNDALFGPGKFWRWQMRDKHEGIKDPRLFYCFVALQGPDRLPRFFIVPSAKVARYVKWQHLKWLRARQVQDNTRRTFRIPLNDPDKYENDWTVLGKKQRARN